MHNSCVQTLEELKNTYSKIDAPCQFFGMCGGCLFQDVSYADELLIKEQWLKELFKTKLNFEAVSSVVRSPQEYHYRHRLDLKLSRFKDGHLELGFSQLGKRRMMDVAECVIARKEISDFLPTLKQRVTAKLPERYKEANITVRSADEQKIHWGGIGKGSLNMREEDYFWTEIRGKKIFFALNTFFQANLFILPKLMEVLRGFPIWNNNKIFFDLYGGVGLFGLNVVDLVKEVYLIEENMFSIQLAHYNVRHHALNNFFITEGRLEEKFSMLLEELEGDDHIAMIDPPRAGLSQSVIDCLNSVKKFKHLIYLSCDPETLIQNCVELTKEEWQIKQVIPFDFFPRTRHLETLVLLERRT